MDGFDIVRWLKDNPPISDWDGPKNGAAKAAKGVNGVANNGDGHPAPAEGAAGTAQGGKGRKKKSVYWERRNLSDDEWKIAFAGDYVSKVESSIEHQRGSIQTFKFACCLAQEFDLSIEQSRPIINRYNLTCVPIWSEGEIQHKLEDAQEKVSEAKRGCKIPKRRKRYNPAERGDDKIDAPEIVATHDEYLAVEEAIDVLAEIDDVYQRSGMLFTVIRDSDEKEIDHTTRSENSPYLREIRKSNLRTILSEHINWVKWRKNDDGEWETSPIHPPEWAVSGIIDHGKFGRIPKIRAIVETPVIRPDGSYLASTGYDKDTGILFEPNAEFESCLSNPTRDDALESLELLGDIVCDFPFKSRLHKCAWLAGLLTPFARFAIDGPVPPFLIDANSAGSGKSLLCDIIGMITTGRPMPRTIYAIDEDEMRKRITSIFMAGDLQILMDNIDNGFGGASIDAATTGRTWKDRILGHSEMITIPINTIWYGTGNNIFFRGDSDRRAIPCRIVTDEETPSRRKESEYKHGGDEKLLEYVNSIRPSLVKACLTILRAYWVSGRPKVCSTSIGSFGAWSDSVRSCILWLTEEDVVDTQEEFRREDPKINLHQSLVHGWAEVQGGGPPLTLHELLTKIKNSSDSKYLLIKSGLTSFTKDGELPTPQKLFYKVRDIKDKVINGKRLVIYDEIRGQCWGVEDVHQSHQGDLFDPENL
jgi:hypothetical protein